MAETYHIYDYEELPPERAAVLCVGLRGNSRVKMAVREAIYTTEEILLASMADSLSFLAWSKTKDAAKGKNRPRSLLSAMMNGDKEDREEVAAFQTADDFEAARKEILEGVRNG